MPRFDVVKKITPSGSFRVSKVQADFDVKYEHANERFVGDIELPPEWNIGVIVGGSGTGKTTIAREVFKDAYIKDFEYTSGSVVDDMPNCSMKDIEKMFYAVGFGSVPSWLKPYNVLSTGEQMRVDLARALLQKKEICFDEFTSVVDRKVAETTCLAISKAVRSAGKKFVAVTCHRDVVEWLQPDWVFDTDVMRSVFQSARDDERSSSSEDAGEKNGRSLGNITI